MLVFPKAIINQLRARTPRKSMPERYRLIICSSPSSMLSWVYYIRQDHNRSSKRVARRGTSWSSASKFVFRSTRPLSCLTKSYITLYLSFCFAQNYSSAPIFSRHKKSSIKGSFITGSPLLGVSDPGPLIPGVIRACDAGGYIHLLRI